MTTLSDIAYLISGTTTEAQFQEGVGRLYNVVKEMALLGPHEDLVIAAGAVTPTVAFIEVDGEGSAPDNLDFIVPTNLVSKVIFVRCADSTRPITLRHNISGTGKLRNISGANYILSNEDYFIAYYYNADTARWEEIFKNFGLYLTTTAEKNAVKALLDFSAYMLKADNLSGLGDPNAARGNLGLGSMATQSAADYLTKAGNLSGLGDPNAARGNLGLGNAATRSVGTSAGNLVEVITGGKLPALDASNLTNIPGAVSMLIVHQVSAGTGGGSATASAWVTRPFNAVRYNDIPGATFVSGVLTLPAGIYEMTINNIVGTTIESSHRWHSKIKNITTNTDLVFGIPWVKVAGWTNYTENVNLPFLAERITLGASNVIEVQNYVTIAGLNFGQPANIGSAPEVYAQWLIRKIG